MVTIHREGGLSVRIFKDDHEPAHVHIAGDGEAKINLTGPDGRSVIVWSVGLSRGDLRRALRIVTERQAEFLERRRVIHG